MRLSEIINEITRRDFLKTIGGLAAYAPGLNLYADTKLDPSKKDKIVRFAIAGLRKVIAEPEYGMRSVLFDPVMRKAAIDYDYPYEHFKDEDDATVRTELQKFLRAVLTSNTRKLGVVINNIDFDDLTSEVLDIMITDANFLETAEWYLKQQSKTDKQFQTSI